MVPRSDLETLKRLKVLDIEHFTVHDMRRTARTHLAGMGVDRFVAERSLNHKLGNVEGIYDRHDYFAERAAALGAWAALLAQVEKGKPPAAPKLAPGSRLRGPGAPAQSPVLDPHGVELAGKIPCSASCVRTHDAPSHAGFRSESSTSPIPLAS